MLARSFAARAAALALIAAAACSTKAANPSPGSSSPTPTSTASATDAAGGTTTPTTTATAGPLRPQTLVAVTLKGDVDVLNPANGKVVRKLAGGAIGDQVSLTPDGSKVYYMNSVGCQGQVMVVPIAGGATPTVVAPYGGYPTVNPQGTKLAYFRQPPPDGGPLDPACSAMNVFAGANFGLIVRDLSSGAETVYGLPPRLITGGLPIPIDHLSWFPDGHTLLLSAGGGVDSKQWNLFDIDTTVDKYYVPLNLFPVHPPGPEGTYFREGVAADASHFFTALTCCLGAASVTPTVMNEMTIAGITATVIQQVAVGKLNVDYSSLDADATGTWLLWLAGTDLQVAPAIGGTAPSTLAKGFLAADW